MFKAAFIIIHLTFIALGGINCEENCDNLGILLYEDLGCRAIRKDGQDCPIKYECDDFTRNNDSCLFRGRNYMRNQQIENDVTYESCNVGCSCRNENEGGAKFVCAILDCPEWLGVPIKPGCYRKYEVDKCCSVGMICPSKDNIPEECNVDGKTYKEGVKFFPKNTCMKCVCPKNFNGKFETPFCKRISCGIQINHAEDLHNKCAPFYLKSEEGQLCCPDTWVCPSTSDKITKTEGTATNSELTCVFGRRALKLGEGFEKTINLYGSDRIAKCECILPPLLTCKEV